MENKSLEKKSGIGGWFKDQWTRNPMFSTLFALVVMVLIQCVVLGNIAGSFLGMFGKLGTAWMNILKNNTYAGLIALGMCFAIISGGIDLSVGSMLCAMGAILMWLVDPGKGLLAKLGITGGLAYVLAIIIIIGVGYVLGTINGSLIAYGGLPPFIATLGTQKIFRSVTQQICKKFSPEVPAGFKAITSTKINGQVILPIIYWIIVVIIMHIVFKKTAFGRKTIAIGSNERAAKLSGINVNKTKRNIYALTGVMCALATIVYVSRIGSMDFANAGSGYEMDAIAAVIVGGTAMSGGRGSLIGTFVGMLIMAVMNNILNSVGIPTFLTEAVKGAIIIFAVFIQKKDKV